MDANHRFEEDVRDLELRAPRTCADEVVDADLKVFSRLHIAGLDDTFYTPVA